MCCTTKTGILDKGLGSGSFVLLNAKELGAGREVPHDPVDEGGYHTEHDDDSWVAGEEKEKAKKQEQNQDQNIELRVKTKVGSD